MVVLERYLIDALAACSGEPPAALVLFLGLKTEEKAWQQRREELAVRAATIASDADVESELFEFSRTVAANPELELALGSRLGDASAKGDLVAKLLTGRASEATVLVASSLVQQPRERRVRQLLSRAIRIVADERGRAVATVTAAAALSAEQASRLTELLSRRYGTGSLGF